MCRGCRKWISRETLRSYQTKSQLHVQTQCTLPVDSRKKNVTNQFSSQKTSKIIHKKFKSKRQWKLTHQTRTTSWHSYSFVALKLKSAKSFFCCSFRQPKLKAKKFLFVHVCSHSWLKRLVLVACAMAWLAASRRVFAHNKLIVRGQKILRTS